MIRLLFSFNVYQDAVDILLSKGFRVFMPDFFKGKPLVPEDMADIPNLMKLPKRK